MCCNKKLLLSILLISLAFAGIAQPWRTGSGNCLYFAGSSSNEHVDLDTIARTFATSDFIVEFWEKMDTSAGASSDIPFICNKDWNSGGNKGFVISKMSTATPSVWVNFTSASGSRFDLKNVPWPTLMTAWTHIAVTFNRNGSSPKIIVYINGIASDSGALTASHSPTTSIVGAQHTRLAQDGTGAYSWGFKYKGFMDEVRIWKTVRSAVEIRSNMCHKLTGTESNLIAYYNFNTASGMTLPNLVSGAENGVLKNMSGTTEWQTSGAAIGDSSVYIYPSSWSTATLQMNSIANGNIKVSTMTGPLGGIQIYRVDTLPNTNNGIYYAGGNNTYYGVFAAQKPVTALATNPVSYDVNYDYSNYSYAVTNRTNLKLYNRYANNYNTWADISAANTISTNTFSSTAVPTRREYIIGDFTAPSCSDPVDPYADSVSASFARIKWTSAGSLWQVQYSYQGFFLGTGTLSTITSSPVAVLTGLTNNIYYDVYVRSICSTGDTSEWTGPLTVMPGYNCPLVSAVTITQLGGDSVKISWTGTSSSIYSMEWGPTGFALGTGIPVTGITTNSYVLHGLAIGQLIDVYIKDSCIGMSSSNFFGPTTFSNTGHGVGIATQVQAKQNITIYPNPAANNIYLNSNINDAVHINIYNAVGAIVKEVVANSFPFVMDVSELSSGTYMLHYSCSELAGNIKISIIK